MPIARPPVKRPILGMRSPIQYTPPQLCALYHIPTNLAVPAIGPLNIWVISLGGGYTKSDIGRAFSAYGQTPPQITDISIGGATNQPGSDADVENLLDIQIAASTFTYATNQTARIKFASAPNTLDGFAQAVLAAGQDPVLGAISISWGSAEKNWGTAGVQPWTAAAQKSRGPIVAAAGDNGSGDGQAGTNVDFPASCPFVIGAGGTTKTTQAETVWNNGRGEGTGGGFSIYYQRPAWQIGCPSNSPGRMVPDMAANADPQTGWIICEAGQLVPIGGTSASAPFLAGFFAAVNSARVAAGKPLLTSTDILTAVYANPAGFGDVIQGDNGQWRALIGPDPCTGLGVPIGNRLAQLFVAPAPPPPPPPGPGPTPQAVGSVNVYDTKGALMATCKP